MSRPAIMWAMKTTTAGAYRPAADHRGTDGTHWQLYGSNLEIDAEDNIPKS
ncbi:hypothetical protein J4530_12125 [Neisseria subflava]|uniref:hypothetical protein n=1 Tax=Neisseria subflava TaxID=28449 RepID=UPI00202A088D|nr:hypothetical protein [Neisseria subflava]MCL9788833.1 hypothetical protein [Neisseria subflava]